MFKDMLDTPESGVKMGGVIVITISSISQPHGLCVTLSSSDAIKGLAKQAQWAKSNPWPVFEQSVS